MVGPRAKADLWQWFLPLPLFVLAICDFILFNLRLLRYNQSYSYLCSQHPVASPIIRYLLICARNLRFHFIQSTIAALQPILFLFMFATSCCFTNNQIFTYLCSQSAISFYSIYDCCAYRQHLGNAGLLNIHFVHLFNKPI